MRTLLLATAVTLFVLVGPANNATSQGEPAGWVLETKPAQRVRGVLTWTTSYNALQAREWFVFAAIAPDLPGQSGMKTKLEPTGAETRDQSPLKRPLLAARIPAKTKDLKTTLSLRITSEGTLHSRRLRPRAAEENLLAAIELSRDTRAAALLEGGQYDFSKDVFRSWLKNEGLYREKGESDLDLGRRVFLALRAKYKWRGPTTFKASETCTKTESDCGGLSVLFASVLRANGVPARTLWGRWAQSADPTARLDDQPFYQTHVKAEFFVKGVGWVPVDLASSILHDKSKEGLEYFGQDPGDFIAFHVDPDFEVNAGPFGRQKVVGLQDPVYWVSGEGSADNPKTSQGWKVEILPALKELTPR
jgi:transglutaminase-like putative cysteine protease